MKSARWIFLIAAICGVLVLAPGLFVAPPESAAPEFYYGFVGSALVWQLMFFLIAREPQRYRPLMLVAVLEKFAFFATCVALYAVGVMTISAPFIGGMIDGVWMLLFAFAYLASKPKTP